MKLLVESTYIGLTVLYNSPVPLFVDTLTGANRLSSVIVKEGVCVVPAKILNCPLV